ncbi:uncharacterized protein F5147DRAFT_821606 [Suillus discolor]|uniref:Uncharacterized protein n=1 Tax=Suillus discolor TaxID=1912936 RepID=A0A9P7EWU9_9AGAM|nr:uncharacterized protein F5147DRAFT_821606 [Suillus discolor]KAG2092829.1 hypothetical protein F5147DRAFT_821606 [Suillus discolor]
MTVSQETQHIRPFFTCAVLRNIKFTSMSYASFIDLQDKLHQTIGHRRSLVAIGTHDLDTLTPPFQYEARTPTNIAFVPLGQETAHTAAELMQKSFTCAPSSLVEHVYSNILRAPSNVIPVLPAGWFPSLSSIFLGLRSTRLLVLAGAERLDTTLMVSQMQGKFWLEVMGGLGVGHLVHARAAALFGPSQQMVVASLLRGYKPSSASGC